MPSPELPRILLVDDDPENIQALLPVLKREYKVFIATDGERALELAAAENLDLVLLDLMMPGMDGYEVLRRLKADERTKGIPVIFATAAIGPENELKGLELGAVDYITKPFSLPIVRERVKTHIALKRYSAQLEEMVAEQTKTISEERNRAVQQLESFLVVLSDAIEAKDEYTGGHVERVARYARDLAFKLELGSARIRQIYLGGIIHDVGKIGIKDLVLNKPGRLDPDEFETIKRHPGIGEKLIQKIEGLEIEKQIVLHHQEKWDGTGYPAALKGADIPLEARIVTLADVWDALITDRPYREAMDIHKALAIMARERGRTFDPALYDLFMDPQDGLFLNYISAAQKEAYENPKPPE
jgi:putative two-component system response regulator